MITPEVRKAVIAAYFALATRVLIDSRCRLTGPQVEEIWAAEIETNLVMRMLGDRPARGFPADDRVTVAKRLVTA